jgi:hypothetical protein
MMVDDGRYAVVAELMIRQARRAVKRVSHMHMRAASRGVLTVRRGHPDTLRTVQMRRQEAT